MTIATNVTFDDMDGFNALIDFVKSHAVQRRYSKGESLVLNNSDVGFVLEGSVCVYYKGNGKFIDNAFYGMPIMEHNKTTKKHPFYYRIESDAVIAVLPTERIFDNKSTHRPHHAMVFLSLIHTIFEKLAFVYETRHGGNGYHVVKELIELYHHETHVTQGLASYILKRTYLSNSYVFKIIATLKKNKYIEMENARLVRIIKPLPDKI
ncbi:helix-turn-helix domain-containing protein [Scandinavium sp. NPDC088450]|uniref:helix-turn-helix domain-containing protein n=1 Tax=Scandinavium sp. NPDC088450 TaxID=3364514 RepID=UPI00384BC112